MKVVSGGQSGADFGGLAAAKACGIETGGWMPCGFLTEYGPQPHWADMFNLKEHPVPVQDHYLAYVLRTRANVRDSDGTIRFASDWKSPGETCTLKAIKDYHKPHIDVDINSPIDYSVVSEWMKNNRIQVLNVAGNRERKSPGIGRFVAEYLQEVFKMIEKQVATQVK
jgi:hypothetical protein